MKLYGFPGTRAQRALWGLKEVAADFDYVSVNLLEGEHRRPEFLRINPAGKVPVLIDGDRVIPESAAIVLYLAEKYPEKALLPVDLEARAQAYRWTMFAVTELEQPLWRMTRHMGLYPPEKRLAAEKELAREDFVAMASILDQHLEAREFIVGNALSVADCVTVYLMDWANELHLLDGFARLTAYMERLYARPEAPQRIAEAQKAA
ncbi:glutathione S-transferase family protein [Paraburkholderia sp. J41]|uniref:glutathione S-transferase family protein n=1 Tax=Paraburkholderia sp. J41 TaxID=2805433 RepID=UPI002AC3137F|nr:glutathione S-transferase family protein [Paraburkholderia sp. J41]